MPKVLLCDAAFSAMPLLQALQAKGLHVSVCGGRQSDPGHALADASFVLDYSDTAALLALVQAEGFDFIVPGCTDVSYLSAASVARTLGLPGFDDAATTALIHHKGLFRDHAARHAYPRPRSATTEEGALQLAFPLLIKPVDAFSGKGIIKVVAPEELALADQARLESRSGDVLFEEFRTGKLYSQSAFIRDGKILIDFFVNEYSTVYPYQVNSSNLETTLGATAKEKMRTWLIQFAHDASLCDGLVHTQFISDGKDIWLIETARRCPGDLYSLLIQRSTSVDYPALYVAPFCALDAGAESLAIARTPISRHTVSVSEECIYVASSINIPAEAIEFIPLKTAGTLLRAAPYDRAGIYFIEHASDSAMEALTEGLVDRVKISGMAP